MKLYAFLRVLFFCATNEVLNRSLRSKKRVKNLEVMRNSFNFVKYFVLWHSRICAKMDQPPQVHNRPKQKELN